MAAIWKLSIVVSVVSLVTLAAWASASQPIPLAERARAGEIAGQITGLENTGGTLGRMAFRGYVTSREIPLRYLEPPDFAGGLD